MLRLGTLRGMGARERGPLVYCLESADNETPLEGLSLALDSPLVHSFRADLLGGVEVITGKAFAAGVNQESARREVGFTAIPYFAWANRGPGEMAIWLPIWKAPAGPAEE